MPAAVTPNQLPWRITLGRAPETMPPEGRKIARPRSVSAPLPSNRRKELKPAALLISIFSYASFAPGAGIVFGSAPGWV